MLEAEGRRAQGATLKDRVFAYEKALIEEALIATHGNQRRAAFHLGVLPTTLHEKMKRLGMVRGSRAAASGAPVHAAERFAASPSPA